jgi:hypothetical protein
VAELERIDALMSSTESQPEYCYLWRENVPSMNVFMACHTQWKWLMGAAGAVRIGLDYAGVRQVLWALKLKDAQAIFNDLRVMEAAALDVFNAA